MKIQQIVETTTAGSVATVAQPMMTQTRENTNVRGLKPVQQVMKGAKKKGPYANSIVESKVTEDDLAEQDLIVIPGQGRLRRTGFIKHDLDQGEHEGHTLKNSLHTIARAASELDKRLSVQSEFPEWVSEKIGAAKSMMVTVMDYLISSQEMQHDSDAMEGVAEGSIKDVESKIRAHDQRKADREQAGDPYVAHELHSHNVIRKQLLDKRKRAQAEYHKKMDQQGVAEGSNNDYQQGVDDGVEYFLYTDGEGDTIKDVFLQMKRSATEPKSKKYWRGVVDGMKSVQSEEQVEQGVAEGIDAAWAAAKEKVSEGAKVDRMVKHVKQSEKKLGHSDKEAENIAWATANKRGMLDNKNKKK